MLSGVLEALLSDEEDLKNVLWGYFKSFFVWKILWITPLNISKVLTKMVIVLPEIQSLIIWEYFAMGEAGNEKQFYFTTQYVLPFKV